MKVILIEDVKSLGKKGQPAGAEHRASKPAVTVARTDKAGSGVRPVF